MFSRLLVYLVCFLKSSFDYQRTNRFFYDLLENPDSRMKMYFDLYMICMVMFSIVMLIYEVDTTLTMLEMQDLLTIVLVFAAEYLISGWIYNDSHQIILTCFEKTQYLKIRVQFLQGCSHGACQNNRAHVHAFGHY